MILSLLYIQARRESGLCACSYAPLPKRVVTTGGCAVYCVLVFCISVMLTAVVGASTMILYHMEQYVCSRPSTSVCTVGPLLVCVQ